MALVACSPAQALAEEAPYGTGTGVGEAAVGAVSLSSVQGAPAGAFSGTIRRGTPRVAPGLGAAVLVVDGLLHA